MTSLFKDRWFSQVRDAGAIPFCKTVSTEFAMFPDPDLITRNPHDLLRRVGGSSSGSAAGVAAEFFPIAFGTQTRGSLSGPANHCGTVGFKPTFGRVSLEGVQAVSPSLDTLGFLSRHVEDISLLAPIIIEDWDTVYASSFTKNQNIVLAIPDGNGLGVTGHNLTSFQNVWRLSCLVVTPNTSNTQTHEHTNGATEKRTGRGQVRLKRHEISR